MDLLFILGLIDGVVRALGRSLIGRGLGALNLLRLVHADDVAVVRHYEPGEHSEKQHKPTNVGNKACCFVGQTFLHQEGDDRTHYATSAFLPRGLGL